MRCASDGPYVVARVSSEEGQATIEAAFAIPILLVLLLMLIQPAIVYYDKIVMDNACQEGCRLLVTSNGQSGKELDDYVRRRLSSIPQADVFHVHGSDCSYKITMQGGQGSSEVSVEIRNELHPLPLFDLGMRALSITNDNGNIELVSNATLPCQPKWALGS